MESRSVVLLMGGQQRITFARIFRLHKAVIVGAGHLLSLIAFHESRLVFEGEGRRRAAG